MGGFTVHQVPLPDFVSMGTRLYSVPGILIFLLTQENMTSSLMQTKNIHNQKQICIWVLQILMLGRGQPVVLTPDPSVFTVSC